MKNLSMIIFVTACSLMQVACSKDNNPQASCTPGQVDQNGICLSTVAMSQVTPSALAGIRAGVPPNYVPVTSLGTTGTTIAPTVAPTTTGAPGITQVTPSGLSLNRSIVSTLSKSTVSDFTSEPIQATTARSLASAPSSAESGSAGESSGGGDEVSK